MAKNTRGNESSVPSIRVRSGNGESINPDGRFVLYWMTAFRRLGWNSALQHAADLARGLGKPLLVVEILKVDLERERISLGWART